MKMSMRDVSDGVLDVSLVGRLDTPGVEDVETRLTAEVLSHGTHATFDLAQVDFVGSMAIRMFVSIARQLAKKNHKLVLYAPQAQVRGAFDTVALDTLIPIVDDAAAARHVAKG